VVECELGHVVNAVRVQVNQLLERLGCRVQRFLDYGLNSFGEIEFVAEIE
jgi:hypothetical protein